MENMGTIFMYIDTFYGFTIHITAKMWTFVYNETSFASLFCLIYKCCTKQS